MLENYNYYSDPRTIAGMSTTYNHCDSAGNVNWYFALKCFEYILDDSDEKDEWAQLRDAGEDFIICFLIWLRSKFSEFSSIPSLEELRAVKEYDEELSMPKVTLRTELALCPVCGGKGVHTNPSIDCGGITGSEWAEWDEDDRHRYSGLYGFDYGNLEGYDIILNTNEKEPDEVFDEVLKELESFGFRAD